MTKLYFKILNDKEVIEAIKAFQKVSCRGFGFSKEPERVFKFSFQSKSDCEKALVAARIKDLCLWKVE